MQGSEIEGARLGAAPMYDIEAWRRPSRWPERAAWFALGLLSGFTLAWALLPWGLA